LNLFSIIFSGGFFPQKKRYPYSMTKNAQYTQAERDLKKAVANHVVWLRGLLIITYCQVDTTEEIIALLGMKKEILK
jgi:hypothetical protein